MHHMCAPFHSVHGENITRFCVNADKSKPNHDQQSDCISSIPYVSRKQSVRFWQKKRPKREQYPEKDETTSFPSWLPKKASFLLLSARLRLFSSLLPERRQ